MKIERIEITNYKSIKNLVISMPSPFSVFVGPNAAGKSNIFQALEFGAALRSFDNSFIINAFGGPLNILNWQLTNDAELTEQMFSIDSDLELPIYNRSFHNYFKKNNLGGWEYTSSSIGEGSEYVNMVKESIAPPVKLIPLNFCRIFLNESPPILQRKDNLFLSSDGSNIEKVLKRVLDNSSKRNEIIETLKLLIPEFEDIKLEVSEFSGEVMYLIIERTSGKPFPKHLLSDGTRNILTLLTALYQSDEPQFLCIEEPENGLNPYVIKEFVTLCREMCEEKGHYIWLNTHSQTLVRELKQEELVLVDKVNGETKIKQIWDINLHGLPLDEAWLTNSLGGGLPW